MKGMLRPAAIVLCAIILSACATGGRLSSVQQEDLEARVKARWTALQARDWNAAYEFTSPAYRSVFTQELYSISFSYMVDLELTSVEILNYDAGAAVASVAVGVMSRPVKQTSAASAAIGTVTTESVEQWVFRNKQWWYSVNR